MGNYRSQLRNLGCPELAVNSSQNKRPAAVKKPRKAKLNYLPPHPTGVTVQTLEQERKELLTMVKMRDNGKNINDKMARTFSHRRQEIVKDSPFIENLQQRWPALFDITQVGLLYLHITYEKGFCRIL